MNFGGSKAATILNLGIYVDALHSCAIAPTLNSLLSISRDQLLDEEVAELRTRRLDFVRPSPTSAWGHL